MVRRQFGDTHDYGSSWQGRAKFQFLAGSSEHSAGIQYASTNVFVAGLNNSEKLR